MERRTGHISYGFVALAFGLSTVIDGVALANGFGTGEALDLGPNPLPNLAAFGADVGISGDRIVVGVPVPGTQDDGYAYFYNRVSGVWTDTPQIIDPVPVTGDDDRQFGYGVFLDGDTAIVGDPLKDIAGIAGAGSAYILTHDGAQWGGPIELLTSDQGADPDFLQKHMGSDVAVNGNFAIVAARESTVNGVVTAGAAYVFERSGSAWNQVARLTAPTPTQGEQFGAGVGVDGFNAAVVPLFGNTGYGYHYDGTDWVRESALTIPDTDQLWSYTGVSDDVVVIAAQLNETTGGVARGAAGVFERDANGVWNPLATLFADAEGLGQLGYGNRVAIDDDILAVTAPAASVDIDGDGNLEANEVLTGSVWVYQRNGDAWDQVAKLLAPTPTPGYQFGREVSIDGTSIVVGEFQRDNPGPGGAYFFEALDGDIDLDGDVDNTDIGIVFGNFTGPGLFDMTRGEGDLDNDGDVDNTDIGIVFGNFGATQDGAFGGGGAVPEPASLCLLGCGAVALCRRRR